MERSAFDYLPTARGLNTSLSNVVTLLSVALNVSIWLGRHVWFAFDQITDQVEYYTGWHKGDQYLNAAILIIGVFLFQGVVIAILNFIELSVSLTIKVLQIPSAMRALWMYVVLKRYRSPTKVVPTLVIKTITNDVDVQESLFDSDAYMLESEAVKGIVFVYMRKEGMPNLARVGMGFVVEQKFYTAAHNVLDAVEIAVSIPYEENTYTVNLVSTFGDDIAVLEKKGLAATLGIKSLKFALIKDSMPVRILSCDAENRRLLTHSCNTQFVSGRASLIFTKSNTRSGDSGMPVLQRDRVVAIHLGASKARKMNVHEIPVHAVENEISVSYNKRNRLVITPDGEGYVAESDLSRVENLERVKELVEEYRARKADQFVNSHPKLDPNYEPTTFIPRSGVFWADMEPEKVHNESIDVEDPKDAGTTVKVPKTKSPKDIGNQESLKKYQLSLASVDTRSLEAGRSKVRKQESIQKSKNSSQMEDSKKSGQ